MRGFVISAKIRSRNIEIIIFIPTIIIKAQLLLNMSNMHTCIQLVDKSLRKLLNIFQLYKNMVKDKYIVKSLILELIWINK